MMDADIAGKAMVLASKNVDRDQAEKWLTEIGVKLIDVWFLKDGVWRVEKQVDDPSTLDETIKMAQGYNGARYALHEYGGRWRLCTGNWREVGKRYRYYDTREAAEMVAIHNG